MKRKCNPFLIGLFTLSAILICAASVFVIIKDKVTQERTSFILFFNHSLNGLDIGSPVKFKGIAIGTVDKVSVVFNEEAQQAYTQVKIDINDEVFYRPLLHQKQQSKKEFYKKQILGGLAAKLSTESLITGKLFIELDYFPAIKIRVYKENTTSLTQIPSIPSDIQNFKDRFESILTSLSNINFHDMSNVLTSILRQIDTQLNHSNLSELINNISAAADAFRGFMASESLTHSIKNIEVLTVKLKDFLKDTSSLISDLQRNINLLIVNLNATANKFGNVCENVSDVLNPNSEIRTVVHMMMLQFNKTAHDLQILLELLQRNPNALLSGIEHESEK